MESVMPIPRAEDPREKILEGLNDAQRRVAEDYTGFSMVSAGPGAGKTATIVRRTAYMIESGVPASSILLFSFTKKAANEIKERIVSFIGEKAVGITVSTYHSFCARQLRQLCRYVKYNNHFSIIDDDDRKKLIDKILYNCNSKTQAQVIMSSISRMKEHHWTPSQAARHMDCDRDDIREILLCYEKYQQALRRNNVMDFDDLLFYMVTILHDNEIVRHQIHNRYRYIIADECQDSSVIDTMLIFLLADPKTMNLCLVGDSDQAIYGFRGANVMKFFETVNKVPHKNYVLGQNYRSTPEIVEAAQSLIRYNKRPDEKTIFSKNPHVEKILLLNEKNPVREADHVAGIISQLVRSGQMKYRDAAILFRNTFLSRNLEDSLRRYHIPYELRGGISFYRREEIKDMISFLTFFENPCNMAALGRIINIPKSGIGEKTRKKIEDYTFQECASYAIISLGNYIKLLEGIAQSHTDLKRVSGKLLAFASKCRAIDAFLISQPKPADLIDKVISVFDYGTYLRERDEETCSDRMMNIGELRNMASGYSSVRDFLEDVLTATPDTEDEDGEEGEEDKVQLMTMHGSKGLEFRIVFIIAANEGVIPSWRCGSVDDIQEERRLFYVAMTRAKENLVISTTRTAMQRARLVPAKPSSFLSQIDPEYLQESG